MPTTLSFVMSFNANQAHSQADLELAFFIPLINFLSGDVENKDSSIFHQIVDIMLGIEDISYTNDPRMHIADMSLTVANLLVLRTLCEILCSVLQDINLPILNKKPPYDAGFLGEMYVSLAIFPSFQMNFPLDL